MMFRIAACIFSVLITTAQTKAQDTHYAGVQDMKIWYNPALKTDKMPLAYVNMRNAVYPNVISYASKAITIELPIVGKSVTDYNNISFVNLALGINTDNASKEFLSASTAMMSLSFALPLNEHNTYLALGFQANYSFNRVGTGSVSNFPNHFDKYGALGYAIIIDPNMSGLNYQYFTAGAGLSLFHSGREQQWYLGASIRHFNHPFTEWSHSSALASNNGIQAGYTKLLNSLNKLSGYFNLTWQAGTNDQYIATRLMHRFNDTSNKSVLLGLGYKRSDALIPDIGFQIGTSSFILHYEINFAAIGNNYHRKSWGLSYKLNFAKTDDDKWQ